MHRFYAWALCMSVASFLAVIYTLLQVDWEGPDLPEPPAAAGGR